MQVARSHIAGRASPLGSSARLLPAQPMRRACVVRFKEEERESEMQVRWGSPAKIMPSCVKSCHLK